MAQGIANQRLLPAVFAFLLFLLTTTAVSLSSGLPQKQAEGRGTVAEVVSFPSGGNTLSGVVYRPAGAGPFPAVLWNHGSAPGMRSKEAFVSGSRGPWLKPFALAVDSFAAPRRRRSPD